MSSVKYESDQEQRLAELREKLGTARRSARLAWETVHHLAQQFDLPNAERVADKELAKLREE